MEETMSVQTLENISVLTKTAFCIILEMTNQNAYFNEEKYEIYVNDKKYGIFRENIVTIFDLQPNTDYEIKARINELEYNVGTKTDNINYLINVKDYNADGDGVADDTAAINTAIYTAPRGAVVYFPAGTYMVSQIYLKSNIDIYLEKGSKIKQIICRKNLSILKGYQKDYYHENAVINASWEGNPLDTYGSILYGHEVENIKIYGQGMIDGSGKEGDWWCNPKQKKIAFRPKNIFLNRCHNITFIGISSKNSASWNIHPYYSDNIYFYQLYLESEKDSPNTDGINPESCHGVTIKGCHFNVGDDCVAIKSGKYFMSKFDYRPCKDITISNCYMGDGHGGIAIGSEVSCGVQNLLIEKCYMVGTDRGIRIKSRRGRGAKSILEGLKFHQLEMKGVRHCLSINMFYCCDPDGKSEYVKAKDIMIKDEMTPEIRDIEVCQITAEDISGCAIFMYGLPESKIKNVMISNSSFAFGMKREEEEPEMLEDFEMIPNLGIFIKNTEEMIMKDNEFKGHYVSVSDKEEVHE